MVSSLVLFTEALYSYYFSLFITWLIVSVHISKSWIYLDEGGMTNQGFVRVENLTSIWWSSRLIRGPVACTERAEDMARNGGASARMCGIQKEEICACGCTQAAIFSHPSPSAPREPAVKLRNLCKCQATSSQVVRKVSWCQISRQPVWGQYDLSNTAG